MVERHTEANWQKENVVIGMIVAWFIQAGERRRWRKLNRRTPPVIDTRRKKGSCQ